MSIKKKILIVALAFGTVAGFGAGFAHLKKHHGHCHRSHWQTHHSVSHDCDRGRQPPEQHR